MQVLYTIATDVKIHTLNFSIKEIYMLPILQKEGTVRDYYVLYAGCGVYVINGADSDEEQAMSFGTNLSLLHSVYY